MINISRESEINLINILIDQDIISGKDLINIKKISTEGNKSQIDAVFELKLTDENKILDVLVFSALVCLISEIVLSPSASNLSTKFEISETFAACSSISIFVIVLKFLIKLNFEISDIAIWRTLPSILNGAIKFILI